LNPLAKRFQKTPSRKQDGSDIVLILEKWKSMAHNEKYRECRKTSGFGPVVAPYVTAPCVVRYFDPRPELILMGNIQQRFI